MTLRDPIVIATIRGLLTALGQAAFTGLTTYQVTGSASDSFVVAALAFLVALGIRGGVEGVWDQRKGPREEPVPELSPRAVHPPGAPGRDFHDMFSRPPGPGPIPLVDFDKAYHYDPTHMTRHPGPSREGCPWCIAESKTAT